MSVSDTTYNIYLEIGKKKVFAAAVEWPGWCRHGRDEASALQALLDAGPRYADLLKNSDLAFNAPEKTQAFHIIERVAGNMTTDFGAPDGIIASDSDPLDDNELARLKTLLSAYWSGFDDVVETAVGHELRKGPRGGGRDLIGIVEHVMGAEKSYLSAMGWKFAKIKDAGVQQQLAQLRAEILQGLSAAAAGEIAEEGPRGGKRWPPRYFVRRSAWHVIDHIWEIEDRVL